MNYLLFACAAIGSAAFAYGLNNIGFSFATSPMSEVILASAIGLVFTGIAATAMRDEFFRNNNHHHQQPQHLPMQAAPPQPHHHPAPAAAPQNPQAPPAIVANAAGVANQAVRQVPEEGRGA